MPGTGFRTAGCAGALAALLLLPALSSAPAGAEEASSSPGISAEAVSAALPASVRDIIAQQLQAIHDRDADRAFSLASADFHEKFGTPQKFLNHLRFTCRTLYNHDTFSFLDAHLVNGALIQKVEIRSQHADKPITALFRVERQQDGAWLVDSFTLLDGDSLPI